MRDKSLEVIYQLVVSKLTLALQTGDSNSLTDLMLNKPHVIVELTQRPDWPLIENLKIQNFDPLSIFIYNHLRYKYIIKGKYNKEILLKAFDNLQTLLMKYVEKTNTPFSEETLWSLFNDLFDLYVKIIENFGSEDLTDIQEQIDNLNLEIEEVTSKDKYLNLDITSLLGYDKIESDNHKEFIVGILFKIFKFKIECARSDKSNEIYSKYAKLFDNSTVISGYLKQSCPVIHLEYEILLNINKFFTKEVIISITNLVNIFKFLKLYKKFKKK